MVPRVTPRLNPWICVNRVVLLRGGTFQCQGPDGNKRELGVIFFPCVFKIILKVNKTIIDFVVYAAFWFLLEPPFVTEINRLILDF